MIPSDPPLQTRRATWNLGKPSAIALVTILLLFLAIFTWGTNAHISGAVVGDGAMEISAISTTVSHREGGAVAEILVGEGDTVTAGQVLIRFDSTELDASLAATESALFETALSIARLEALIEGREALILPPELATELAADTRPEVASLLRRQSRQLELELGSMANEEALLDEQAVQIQAQIEGVRAQILAKTKELALLQTERADAQGLTDKGLGRKAELLNAQRAEVAAEGELGRLVAQEAELRGRLAETRLKRQGIATTVLGAASVELTRLKPDLSKSQSDRLRLLDQKSRLDIRAPVSGRVHQSNIAGLRSVVIAGAPLLQIIPAETPVQARIRIEAADIDQVRLGQETSLKFRAFNGRQIPVILGQVRQVSAASLTDPRTAKTYFEVLIALDPAETAKLGDRDLIAGMPVEAFMSTAPRTPIQYLLQPLVYYFDRAFRDG